MTCLHRGIAPMDDIPLVTALYQDATKGMICLHRGIAPMDDIPSVTTLHQDATIDSQVKNQDEDSAKSQLGPGNDLPT